MFDRKKQIVIGILMAVLIAACAAGSVYLLTSSEKEMPIIGTAVNLVALACAVLYCTYGYQKNMAVFYKGFFLFYALDLLVGAYGMVVDFGDSTLSAVTVVAFAVTFGNVLLLFVPDNFGRKKSAVAAAVNMAIWLGFLIHHFVFRSGDIGIYTIRIGCYLVSAILAAVMMYAKYADKEARLTD